MTLVLIVDDSKFMRTVLRNTLQDYGYSVIEASNGEKAVKTVKERNPDVVTMDVVMGEMNGLEATQKIMKENPTPILMLSAHTIQGADITLEALKKGAVDFISKPGGKESPITAVEFGDGFIDTVEAVSQVDVSEVARTAPDVAGKGKPNEIDVPEPRTPSLEIPAKPSSKPDSTQEQRDTVEQDNTVPDSIPTIVIGASTGGPSLVEDTIKELPAELNARVFVVQHMPEGFTTRYAKRLNKVTLGFDVVEAAEGMSVEANTVYVAPGNKHMTVSEDGTTIETSPLGDKQTTSINETLYSIADTYEPPIVVALLTGMGDDGCAALDAIKDAEGYVIAQDGETSPVFGIPRRAIQTGNVDTVLSDYKIAKGIVEGIDSYQR